MTARLAAAVMCLWPVAAAAGPSYKVRHHVSLETVDQPPSFVCLDGIWLLDRGNLVQIGRPMDRSNAFHVVDLKTLETRLVEIPELRGGPAMPKSELGVDRPAFYDTRNAHAGILLRGGGLVTGDSGYAEWDLKANRIVRRLPLGGMDGARYMSVQPIGYDPASRECFIEIVRTGVRYATSPNKGGHFDVSILGVTDTIRPIAAWTYDRKLTSKGPYFDPVRKRSMHVEYAEYAGNISMATVVDLTTGAINQFPLPPLIYGFTFDPDGKTGWAYSERLGEVFAVDLTTGAIGRKAKPGRKAHVLDFVAPGVLFLGRNGGMHFFETAKLRQTGLISPKKIYASADHLEGTLVLPGRVLMRNYEHLYVLDFPGLMKR